MQQNSCVCTAAGFPLSLTDVRREHGQVLVFGGFSGRVRRRAAGLAAEQHVQTQLAGLAEENSELRRLYKHMETQLTFAAEELSGAQPHVPLSCAEGLMSRAAVNLLSLTQPEAMFWHAHRGYN